MEIHAPNNWMEVDRETFFGLLDQQEWRRDGFANGEIFTLPKYPKDKNGFEKHVASRVDGRYFIDPTFFKPVSPITR